MTSPQGAERPGMGLAMGWAGPVGAERARRLTRTPPTSYQGSAMRSPLFSPYHRSSMTARVAR